MGVVIKAAAAVHRPTQMPKPRRVSGTGRVAGERFDWSWLVAAPSVPSVLALQRLVGNAAVTSMFVQRCTGYGGAYGCRSEEQEAAGSSPEGIGVVQREEDEWAAGGDPSGAGTGWAGAGQATDELAPAAGPGAGWSSVTGSSGAAGSQWTASGAGEAQAFGSAPTTEQAGEGPSPASTAESGPDWLPHPIEVFDQLQEEGADALDWLEEQAGQAIGIGSGSADAGASSESAPESGPGSGPGGCSCDKELADWRLTRNVERTCYELLKQAQAQATEYSGLMILSCYASFDPLSCFDKLRELNKWSYILKKSADGYEQAKQNFEDAEEKLSKCEGACPEAKG
jgi:hypothetical protein